MPPTPCVLLQHCTPPASALLDVTSPVHQSYCDRFGIEYRSSQAPRRPDRESKSWEKIQAIVEELDTIENGTLVVWLDADSLIVHPEDLRNAFQTLGGGSQLGMVQTTARGFSGGNAGVLYFRATPLTRSFFLDVNATGSVSNPYGFNDQWTIHTTLQRPEYSLLRVFLDSRWNSYPWAGAPPTAPVVVRSWHGEVWAKRYREIKAAAAEFRHTLAVLDHE